MLRHAISDLIARKFPIEISMEYFLNLMNASTPKSLHMALTGFDVLKMSRKIDNDTMKMLGTYIQNLNSN